MKKSQKRKFRKKVVRHVDVDLLQNSYLMSLEDQVARLNRENDEFREQNRLLVDRIVHMATGAPLAVSPESRQTEERQLTPEQKEAIHATIDKMSNDKPFGGYPTMAALLQSVEAVTFHQAADAQTGTDEIEPGAEVQNSVEADDEDQRQAKLSLRKASMIAAAKAHKEYLENTPPVIR